GSVVKLTCTSSTPSSSARPRSSVVAQLAQSMPRTLNRNGRDSTWVSVFSGAADICSVTGIATRRVDLQPGLKVKGYRRELRLPSGSGQIGRAAGRDSVLMSVVDVTRKRKYGDICQR